MPEIKPITYLRNTKELTKLCDKGEAVYLTKNGCKALTVVNSEKYDRDMDELVFRRKIMEGMKDIFEGNFYDAEEILVKLDKKYGI